MLGALAATAGVRRALDAIPDRWTGSILAALVLVLGAAWALIDGVQWPWLFTHSLAAATLIGLCARGSRTMVAHFLSWEPLRWLGSVSYGLYLWHWPVIVLLDATASGGRTAAAYAISILLAALSKRLVEDPVRFRAAWARGRSGAIAFAGLMIALALLWIVLPAPAPPTIDLTGLG
nr:acyltransferase family protein [Actinoplanes brasiliensis]